MRRFLTLLMAMIKARKPPTSNFQQISWVPNLEYVTLIEHQNTIEIKDAVKTMTMGNHDNSQCFDYFSNNLLHFRVDPSIQSPKNEQADPS